MPLWLLDKDSVAGHSLEALEEALTSLKVEYVRASLIDREIYPVPDRVDVFPYGNVAFIQEATKFDWTPGVRSGFDDWSFTTLVWDQRLGLKMLNYGGVETTIGEAPPLWGKLFVRPFKSDKTFNAFVGSWDTFLSWRRIVREDGILSDTTPIFMAPWRDIVQEVRFFVVGKKIVTGSYYRNNRCGVLIPFFDSPFFDEKIRRFAESCVDKWGPDDSYVMDVCRLADGELAVVEFNPINSSGLYECDALHIVQAVENHYG